MLQKKVARPIVVHNNFQEGFGHYTNQNTPLKGENKWESSEKTQFNWTGHCRAQRNELIVPGQNIAFSSREGLSEFLQLKNEAYIFGLGLPESF